MFRITEDPSSGSLLQCLAKNYKNDSIVSVNMGKFGVSWIIKCLIIIDARCKYEDWGISHIAPKLLYHCDLIFSY